MTARAPGVRTLSAAEARRVALAAQGFADRRHAEPTMRTLQRTVRRTGVLQVDSVNVLQRAHYMPLYSRMGAYDVDLLRRASAARPRRLVEYWAHVQALMPVELWPHMRHRMDDYRERRGKWGFTADPTLEPRVLAAVAERGPVTARELEAEVGGTRSREHWGWNWSEARKVLDYLFLVGDVAVAGRTPSFEIVFDLPERVLPAAVLAAPTPTRAEAELELVRRASRSHGVATLACLADYYRMPVARTRAAVATLADAGELEPVRVQGWSRPAWLAAGTPVPRRVEAGTLLSPFDPLVWQRARTEALFGFRYRLEIYTPAHRRVHGYYVLPFLLGERLVGRVDLKADRATGRLLVQSAHREPDAPPETAEALGAELARLGEWLGLDEVVLGGRGDLRPVLPC
ncbi:winged helix-turn-helix domain-containing protein [Nocardioides campestrisoli]|uniref:winged helix-turn-helix domain-containing protein n=1 Tax=Nocardioides campestrisoli TaxID=2736757 RepID=UPI001CD1F1CB|nr:crosslink repair DNA glycosylase YcaQ family protein [Nocardioides campestrisoli]